MFGGELERPFVARNGVLAPLLILESVRQIQMEAGIVRPLGDGLAAVALRLDRHVQLAESDTGQVERIGIVGTKLQNVAQRQESFVGVAALQMLLDGQEEGVKMLDRRVFAAPGNRLLRLHRLSLQPAGRMPVDGGDDISRWREHADSPSGAGCRSEQALSD